MHPITSVDFYRAWLEAVSVEKDELLAIWRNNSQVTDRVLSCENSIIKKVAYKIGLECYSANYYSVDAILFTKDNRVPQAPTNQHWFREIKVAFEHENNFKSGLFKEVSHLLITNCQLRVLVTYPGDHYKKELDYLHEIIEGVSSSQAISDDESFLLVLGGEAGFVWDGLVFKMDGWKQICL